MREKDGWCVVSALCGVFFLSVLSFSCILFYRDTKAYIKDTSGISSVADVG